MISSPTGANLTVYKSDQGLFVVDTQLKVLNFFIKRHINNISKQPIKYIVNTHWHPDHNGGNAKLGENAVIIGHENLKKRMQSAQKGYGLTKPGSSHDFKPRKAEDLPTKLFTDTLIISFNNEDINIFHVPNSHTDTDAVVYFKKSNVLCVGDLVWKDKFPYVDNFNEGSVLGLNKALSTLIAITNSNTKVISGHSDISSRNDMIETNQMISKSIDFVQSRISKNLSLTQIQEEGLSSDMQSWASDLVPEKNWIEMVYKSLN